MKSYKVICKKCKGSNVVAIDEHSGRIFWDGCDRIISGRRRLDGKWGWQCLCGNNSILTKQEDEYITDKVNPDPKEIEAVIKNLIPETKNIFSMQPV